jgi:hypothetical protein
MIVAEMLKLPKVRRRKKKRRMFTEKSFDQIIVQPKRIEDFPF